MTALVAGSTRAIVPLALLATQIDPAPATTFSSPFGLAIPVAMTAVIFAVLRSIRVSVKSLQSATHSDLNAIVIAPHGWAIGTSARLPLRDQRSTRPLLVAHTVLPSTARKSAKPGTGITCSIGLAANAGATAMPIATIATAHFVVAVFFKPCLAPVFVSSYRSGRHFGVGAAPALAYPIDQWARRKQELFRDRQPSALVLAHQFGFAAAVRAEDAIEQD